MPPEYLEIGRSQFKVSDFLGWQREKGLELVQLSEAGGVEAGCEVVAD